MCNRCALRSSALFAGLALLLAPTLSVSANAAGTTSPPAGSGPQTSLNLNLKSQYPSIMPLHNLVGAQINVAGTMRTVTAGTTLTPAEYVAAMQILNSGKQTLVIDSTGAAIGGSLNLTPSLGRLTALVLPQNVTAVDNTHAQSTLAVTGALIDGGSLIGTGVSGSTFHIAAGSLNVTSTGGISTAPGINLSIKSIGDIINSGSIISGGNLALNGNGIITNNSGSTISGATGATLFAGSGQINNAGTIVAQAGNLVLNSASTTQLVVNNTSGILQASLGSVDLRTGGSATSQLTQLTGGDVLSQDLNAYGGTGNVQINAGNISGVVNLDGGSIQLAATNTPVLQLGNIHATGDPLIMNSTANSGVNLTGVVTTDGQPFTVLSNEDITATGATGTKEIDTSSKTGPGGDVSLIAGVGFVPSGTSIEVVTTDAFGGNVSLSGVNITTGSTKSGANGGSVTVFAPHGTASGDVSLGSINTSAAGGSGGAITIYSQDVVTTGALSSEGKTAGGAVVIKSLATLSVSGTPTYDNSTSPSQGNFTGGGSFSSTGNPVAGSTVTVNGSINTAASAGSGGFVTILTGDSIQVGLTSQTNRSSIITTGASGSNHGGSILLSTGSDVNVAGSINMSAPDNSNQDILITESANNSFAFVGGSIQANGTVKGGGAVTIEDTDGIRVIGNINNSGITTGNSLALISSVGSALSEVQVVGSINSSGKTHDGAITLLSKDGTLNVSGGINGSGNGPGGQGANITIQGDNGVTIGGDINASGGAPGPTQTNGGGSVSVKSTNANISIAGAINISGARDGLQSISLIANTGVEVEKGMSAVGSVSSGSVTVTNSTSGDIRLGYNILNNNAPGTTPLLLNANGGINVSSLTNSPGSVTITNNGGSVYVADGINESEGPGGSGATAGGISVTASERVLVAGPVNSSNLSGTAGPITLIATGTTTGTALAGLDIGVVNSSGKFGGGAVTLDSENGSMVVRGSINTSSADGAAGGILSNSLNDTLIQGAITAQGAVSSGLNITLFAGQNAARTIAPGILTIQGAINTTPTSASQNGASIFVYGQTGITVGGSILDTGATGGTVTANSNDGILTINGNINTSSNNATGPGNAGSITLNSFSPGLGSGTFVTGNIIARGGNATGPNGAFGGSGGTVMISTSEFGTTPIGSIVVGSIDTQGGNTSNPLVANPGQGGSVTLAAATIQLTNTAAGGASINASAGVDPSNPMKGGLISVTTDGLQPIPANLNLLSTKATVVAMPGAMFTVGNDSVNGSAGVFITSASTGKTQTLGAQPIIGSLANPPSQISVSTGTINNPGIYFLNGLPGTAVGPRIVNSKGVESMVTPSEAIALYQTTRNLSQTFGLTPQGNAFTTTMNPTYTGQSTLTIQVPAEFSKNYTSFVLSTNSNVAGPNGLTITIPLTNNANVITPSVFIGLPNSSPSVIGQTLNFTASGSLTGAYVQLASTTLTVGTDGQVKAGQNLNFFGNGAVNIVNDGMISAGMLNFRSPTSVTITAGSNSQTDSSTAFNASGSLGIATPTGSLNLLSAAATNLPASVTIANGQFLEKNIAIGAQNSSFAQLGASINLQQLEAFGAVNITVGVNNNNVILVQPNALVAATGNINVTTTSGAIFEAFSGLINSGGSINITGSGAELFIGTVKIVANNNINMISQGEIADLGSQLNVNAIKGNLVIGSSLAQPDAISLTGPDDQITSGGNMTIYGSGLAGINMNINGTTGLVQANGVLQLGGAPALHVVNNQVDSILGVLSGNKGVNLTLGTNSNSTIGTLTSRGGAVQANITGAVVTFDGELDGGGVNVTSTSNIIFGNGNGGAFSSSGNITIKSQGTITFPSTNSVILLAGNQVLSATGTQPIQKSQLTSKSSIDVEGNLGVTFGTDTSPTNTLPNVQAWGGNIVIKSSEGTVTLGNQMSYGAFGGNLSILGQSGIVGGTTSSGGPAGNVFAALAAVNGSSSIGGGIEIRGGTTTSTIANSVAKIPDPFENQVNPNYAPNLIDFATLNVAPPAKGIVSIGPSSAVQLNDTADGVHGATLQGQNPVIIISGTLTAPVTLDSVFLTSATPISDTVRQLDQDEVIVDTDDDSETADSCVTFNN
jgi:hypothetical protein